MTIIKSKDTGLYLILHNLRSTYNVGSIFRTADASNVSRIFLTGYTPTPDNPKVLKTSLGSESSLPWVYRKHVSQLIKGLKTDGVKVICLEQTIHSIDYRSFIPVFPMAIIFGNEVKGLSKSILKYADQTIQIPMHGKKESLNVSVACGIALYKINEHRPI